MCALRAPTLSHHLSTRVTTHTVWILLARREGGGETQMRTESLCSAVSQILLEAQELMNAARSQCVAQQLQLYSTHYLTETALKMEIKEENEEWLTK